LDKKNAHSIKPDPGYREQHVEEVWFQGYHSDVGGGDEEAVTASVPFRLAFCTFRWSEEIKGSDKTLIFNDVLYRKMPKNV
jgi:hypothetical protein